MPFSPLGRHGLYCSPALIHTHVLASPGPPCLVPFSVGLALMDAQVFVPAVLSAQAVALLPSVNFPYITGSPPVKPGQGEVPRDYLRVPYVTVPCTTLSCLTPEGSQEALLVPAQPSVLSLGSLAAAKYSLDSVTPQNREGLGSRTVS